MAAVADAPPGKAHSRSGAADPAGRSCDPRRAGVSGGSGDRPQGRGGGQARHVRRRARPSPKRDTATSARTPGARRRRLPIAQFVEKPDLPTAQTLRRVGEYFWNSGMFMFRASAGARRAARGSRRRSTTRARRRTPRPSAISISRACRPRSSAPARAIRSTTRSWRRRSTASSCRSTPAGATSARGRRCTKRSPATSDGNVRIGDVLTDDTQRLLPAIHQPPGRGRRARRITSSSKPRTRCWSRRRAACRT